MSGVGRSRLPQKKIMTPTSGLHMYAYTHVNTHAYHKQTHRDDNTLSAVLSPADKGNPVGWEFGGGLSATLQHSSFQIASCYSFLISVLAFPVSLSVKQTLLGGAES